MFLHVVLLSLNDQADESFHQAVEAYAERIRTELPYVRSYRYAQNAASRARGLTWVVVGLFDSERDHDRYQESMVHQEMSAFIAPFATELVACDVDEL